MLTDVDADYGTLRGLLADKLVTIEARAEMFKTILTESCDCDLCRRKLLGLIGATDLTWFVMDQMTDIQLALLKGEAAKASEAMTALSERLRVVADDMATDAGALLTEDGGDPRRHN